MQKMAISGRQVIGFFLLFRLTLLILLPYDVFVRYGDLINFFRVAEIPGWPYVSHWVEFPPVFPFLSEIVYRLSGGVEQVYVYVLAGIFSLFDAGNIFLFGKLAGISQSAVPARRKLMVYGIILSIFPYGWWYFEPIVVFFLLLSTWLVLQKKPLFAGVSIGLGILTKVFPVLVLIPAWFAIRKRDFVVLSGAVMIPMIIVIGTLGWKSPDFTSASLVSQYSKGSWETVWALVDGNFGTGNFGPLRERLDPSMAYVGRGNPARIPTFLPLGIAGLVGLVVLRMMKNFSSSGLLSLIGLGWCLLVIASPGWSPQWVLLIIPICLLVFPMRQGLIITALLMIINFAEWPLIISRGRVDLLWMTIVLRTLVILILAILFASMCMKETEKLKLSA